MSGELSEDVVLTVLPVAGSDISRCIFAGYQRQNLSQILNRKLLVSVCVKNVLFAGLFETGFKGLAVTLVYLVAY